MVEVVHHPTPPALSISSSPPSSSSLSSSTPSTPSSTMSQPITDIAAHIAAPVAESAEPTKLRVEEGAVPVNSVAVAVAEDAGVPPPPGTAEPVPLPNAEGATQPTAPATPPKTTTPSAATVLLATTVPPSVTPTATEAELAQPAHTPPHPNAKVAALQAELARLKNELG